MRGERLHRWLAKLLTKNHFLCPGELNEEEYETVIGFFWKDVSKIVFRPESYAEQQTIG